MTAVETLNEMREREKSSSSTRNDGKVNGIIDKFIQKVTAI